MIPYEYLGTAMVPGGVEIRLYKHDRDFMILLKRDELMSTRMRGSEEALAVQTIERLTHRPAPRILIGGYGMGFTLRAALATGHRNLRLTVAEIVPEIIEWARGPRAELTAGCLEDPRVALELRDQIEHGIQAHGLVTHPTHGRIYAYETDGHGRHLLMDDANVPSLLSIPYLGYRSASDDTYRNTRRFILSPDNPYFFAGKYAAGIGSPHTPGGLIWPISLAMQGLTSTSADEREDLLETLISTTNETAFMHEAFDPNDPSHFTRPWFAWANSLFAEFALRELQSVAR